MPQTIAATMSARNAVLPISTKRTAYVSFPLYGFDQIFFNVQVEAAQLALVDFMLKV